MELRNQLKKHRQQKKLTQVELAEKVGVTRQTIISIEKARYHPSVKLALHLAQELAVPLQDLFWLAEGDT